jgi:hypothetical protein
MPRQVIIPEAVRVEGKRENPGLRLVNGDAMKIPEVSSGIFSCGRSVKPEEGMAEKDKYGKVFAKEYI